MEDTSQDTRTQFKSNMEQKNMFPTMEITMVICDDLKSASYDVAVLKDRLIHETILTFTLADKFIARMKTMMQL